MEDVTPQNISLSSASKKQILPLKHTLSINPQLCIDCGTCAQLCVQSLLDFDASGHMAAKNTHGRYCIDCGHCVAACPTAAISLNGRETQSLPMLQNLPLTLEQQRHLFQGRRTVRRYSKHMVPHDIVEQALDMARYAPSGFNAQEVEWLLVEGHERLHIVNGAVGAWGRATGGYYGRMGKLVAQGEDVVTRGAPALLLAHVPTEAPWGVHDACAALTYLELALHSSGLGTCWAGFVIGALASGTDLGFSLPLGRQVPAALLFGYPEYTYVRVPERKELRFEIIL